VIEIEVPGRRTWRLQYGVFDFNGTLALDGRLREGAAERLRMLADRLELHIWTGDSHGTARAEVNGLPVQLAIVPAQNQAEAKQTLLRALGAAQSVAVGNGYNDRLVLTEAALGIAVLEREGAAVTSFTAAEIVCPTIIDALDLLLHPRRIVATLRA